MRAVELDDASAEAHVALAGVKIFADFDWPGAQREFRRALALNPNDALAHHWYANLYLDPQGHYEDGIAEMKRAQELDPLSLIINTDLGYAYYVAGQDDAAASQYLKVLEMDPNFLPARDDLWLLYIKQQNYEAAWRERIESLRIAAPAQLVSKVEEVHAREGYRGVQRRCAASQGTYGIDGYPKSAWETAMAYVRLGQKGEAIASLETAYEENSPAIIYIKRDPFWDSLRNEKGFKALQQEIGLLQ